MAMNDCIECPLCDEVVKQRVENERLQAEVYALKTNSDIAFACAKSLSKEVDSLKATIDQQDEINDGLGVKITRQRHVIAKLHEALRKRPLFPEVEIEELKEQIVSLRAELANAKADAEAQRAAHDLCLNALVKIQNVMEELHKDAVKCCIA